MTRRLALFATVLSALALALAGALLAPAPHDLPAVALGATLVWRAEVAAILFAAAYAAIVTARLALEAFVERMEEILTTLERRVSALENPSHLLLNQDREDT